VVCPGSIRTPQLRRSRVQTDEEFEASGVMWPMKRHGDPDEIAEPIVWLLSDKSSYITGLAVQVDGGDAALR
jgi:NAD(P)-dependent dehydrogenase (short-subunit alcohol dehydrogenase family)